MSDARLWPGAVIGLAKGIRLRWPEGTAIARVTPWPDLILATAADRRGHALDAVLRRLLRWRFGDHQRWIVERDAIGAPRVCSADGRATAAISIAHADGRMLVAIAKDGAFGVDMETRGRIVLNTTPGDRWLSPVEQQACATAADATAALACRWVLKEALGKALGTGLPPRPDLWSFDIQDRIDGSGLPIGFRFGLFATDDLLIGVARRCA